MSPVRAGMRLGPALLASAVLAACSVTPTRPPATPAVVTARPEPPSTIVTPMVSATVRVAPWHSLAASFVMHDCADSPLIHASAAMYTRSPRHFERRLEQALPLLMYVQAQLHDAGIPGEFALLPMLESWYQPAASARPGAATGMWQMMPGTARQHGIVVARGYDGRLDPVASTRAAIHMLRSLRQRFDDWRLVDMAYNAGPYAVSAALKAHPDAIDSPVPHLLSKRTRTHLARLMALSCIVREPLRYHVKLPESVPEDQLIAARVPAGTRLDAAAGMAGVDESALRALNPGYTGAVVPAKSPRTLLLPATAAESLAEGLAMASSDVVAEVDGGDPSAADAGADPPRPVARPDAPGDGPNARAYRVRKGDTLWSIAHRYHVSVADLKQWNDLDGNTLHPGETLDIQG